MIPILYPRDEYEFQTEGFGRLTDIISCVVNEERNGVYEVEFEYPITGTHYEEIIEGRIISCTHDEAGDRQPFVIYRRSAPINGIVTFNARHISYELANVIVKPYQAINIVTALAGFHANAMTECRFTFDTDKAVTVKQFQVKYPRSIWELLGGSEGSILDVYGTGEWEFDNFDCFLHLHRGSDSGVTIRYAKNLIDLTHEVETDEIYDAIVPYYYDAENADLVYGGVVFGDYVISHDGYLTTDLRERFTTDTDNWITIETGEIRAIAMDFTEAFENKPTKAQLETTARNYLNDNEPWLPKENYVVDFVSLWQTEEYKDYAQLQQVKLCDTVTVDYDALGVHSVKMKVVRTAWNCLLERYDEIELGTPRTSLGDLILSDVYEELSGVVRTPEMLNAIESATQLLTGNRGGYLVFHYDGNGEPYEMLIMDTNNIQTAQKIWRYNASGWGYSNDGGVSYALAATMNGAIVADFITAGVLTANIIKAGTIQGNSDNNYWNLATGTLSVQKGYIGNFTISGSAMKYGDQSDLSQSFMQLSGTSGLVCDYPTQVGVNDVTFRTRIDTASGQMRWFYRYMSGGSITTKRYWSMGIETGLSNAPIIWSLKDGSNVDYIRAYASDSGNDGFLDIGDPDVKDVQIFGKQAGIESDLLYMWCGEWVIGDMEGDFQSTYISNWYNWGERTLKNIYISAANGEVRIDAKHIVFKSTNPAEVVVQDSALYVGGNFTATGTKNRIVETEDYGNRLLYAYETASPLFGDVGDGVIGEDGKCYVWLDPKLTECITGSYQVFLQAYGRGECYVSERTASYFVVEGDAGLSFGWELKAKQKGYEAARLDVKRETFATANTVDYGELAMTHINGINTNRRDIHGKEGHKRNSFQ